jgi:ComF family protein
LCPRCGLPENGSSPDGARPPICKRCERTSHQLDGLRSFAFHSGPLRHAIHQFKYQDLRSLAGPLGKLMSDGWFGLAPQNLDLDVIVSVPLHPTRLRQRGFNQATLLARELGARLQLPVMEDVLIRTRATAPQVELGAQERRANVHNAFRCTGTGLSDQRVLLVDDVCTTGSTLDSACMALREADASLVWAYTLARARPGPQAFG